MGTVCDKILPTKTAFRIIAYQRISVSKSKHKDNTDEGLVWNLFIELLIETLASPPPAMLLLTIE